MIIYMLDSNHKIEVTVTADGRFVKQMYERVCGDWRRLGPSTYWYSLEDIKFEYGID